MLEVNSDRCTTNTDIIVASGNLDVIKRDFWPTIPINKKVIVELSKD